MRKYTCSSSTACPREAESVAAAAKNSSAMAASDAHRAESKSDTFRHEFSCLARVQAVKLEELALKRMKSMPLSTYLVVSAE